jgi:hypothetical protein
MSMKVRSTDLGVLLFSVQLTTVARPRIGAGFKRVGVAGDLRIWISLIVPGPGLRVTRGAPKFWSRATDSGHTLECVFCPDCGSRLWHQLVGAAETISVKGGSSDNPIDLRSAVHIWTSRMLPRIILPEGAVQFPGEPA